MARLLLVLVLAVAAAVAQSLPAHVSAAPSPSWSYRCGWCPRRSTASLLPPDAGILIGAACGYCDPADLAADGGFHIATVSAGFFHSGRACGACYQLRCRDRGACAEDGVKVVVVADVAKPATDTNRTGGSQFQLTKDAFAALTASRDDGQLRSLVDAAVNVDFRRIPCAYKSKNLAVRVDETSSRNRGHLALRFLYHGGQTDIVAVEVAQAAALGAAQSAAAPSPMNWQYMTRHQGSPGGWRTSRAPAGPLQLRLVVTAGSGSKWLRAEGAMLPAKWQPGAAALYRPNGTTRSRKVKRNGGRGITAKKTPKARKLYNDALGIFRPGTPHRRRRSSAKRNGACSMIVVPHWQVASAY
ncbi:expansin-like A4 isoform X1 [Triticum aestivum]|uniref:expansin-like A4 isoform X1 n=1 Tax=Triticum aestivum TaxID=4565 RepID=UPI001D02E60E|nr:expansin-like A4 isoform X1 [Triticum aestivum]